MKKCSGCKIIKKMSEFNRDSRSSDGHNCCCKKCLSDRRLRDRHKKEITDKKYYTENRDKIREKQKQKYLSEREQRLADAKIYREQNIEVIKLKQKQIYIRDRDKRLAAAKEYQNKNKDKKREFDKKYRRDNKEKLRIAGIKKREKNREYIKQYMIKYAPTRRSIWRKKWENDAAYRISFCIRASFNQKLKQSNIIKTGETFSYTGILWEEYVEHFKNDLLWGDYVNKIQNLHIDHIIPCSLYDFSDSEEIKKCWDKRNLRLFPASENISKNNKFIPELVEQYQIHDLLPKKLLTDYKK